MNKIYRLVWDAKLLAWIAAPECARGQRKGSGSRSRRAIGVVAAVAGLSLACGATPGLAAPNPTALPTGGTVTAGSGSINQSGAALTVNQQSPNLSLNWTSFNIGSQGTVNFVQPGSSSIAVNRIGGNSGSQIYGHLNANGQVYLINPNGVLFGQGAQVNVGGLVASTLDVSDSDLGSGKLSFSGNGTGSVINQGTITAKGGLVALLGNKVINEGVISAHLGQVALAGGSAVTLTLSGDQLFSVQVDKSTLDNLAQNGQLIEADGGQVWMTAGARDSLLASAVNNTGTVQAQTVQSQGGHITLLSGMGAGTTTVGGTLDASAPNGGDGGSVETSGHAVQVADGADITTVAPQGKTGTWLIDPTDFTISSGTGVLTMSGIGATTLDNALNTNSVTLATANTGTQTGDINVDSSVSWSANTLTLNAANNINVNAAMNAIGSAGLALNYGGTNGLAAVTPAVGSNLSTYAPINLTASNTLSINGTPYTIVTALGAAGSTTGTDLQGISGNLSGHYVLGTNIDASATSNWNGGAGFAPIGSGSIPFAGVFDGLGHTISNLTINDVSNNYVGLFGFSAGVIRNVNLVGGSVTGGAYAGDLAGDNSGAISNASAGGSVVAEGSAGSAASIGSGNALFGGTGDPGGDADAGGLVGNNSGTITSAYATGSVSATGGVGGNGGVAPPPTEMYSLGGNGGTGGSANAGGLVGNNTAAITNSYATGVVSATGGAGGGAGAASSSAGFPGAFSGQGNPGVSGSANAGGLIGSSAGTITNNYATGAVSETGGIAYAGGLVGVDFGTISNAYATGAASGLSTGGDCDVGGLVGVLSGGTINNAYALGAVSADGQDSANGGGLVGLNRGTINYTYATGKVTAVGQTAFSVAGGLVGGNNGPVAASYFDSSTAGSSVGNNFGSTISITPITTEQWLTVGPIAQQVAGWAQGSVWVQAYSYPVLSTLPYVLATPTGTSTYGSASTSVSVIPSTQPMNPQVVVPAGWTSPPLTANLDTSTTRWIWTGTPTAASPAGSTFLFSGAGGSAPGFQVAYTIGTLTVAKAPLTITASNAGATYNGQAYSGGNGVSYSGFVNGQNSSVLGGTLSYGGSSQGAVDAGSYSITPSGLTSTNYAISYVSGTLTINPLAVTISGTVVANSKTYDGTTMATVTGGTLQGVLPGDVGNVTLSGIFSTANVGTNIPVTATVSGAKGENYAIAVQPNPSLSANITPASLTVTANGANKTYDGQAFSGGNGVSYSGFVNGQTSSVLGGTLSYGGTSQGAVNAGSYSITPSGLTSGNYSISYVSGALTISPVTVTIGGTLVANSKTYDGTTAAVVTGGTLQGVLPADAGGVTLSGVFSTANAGINIPVTATLVGAQASDYTISQQPTPGLSANITPASLTVTANGASKTYNGQAFSGGNGVSYSGFVNGQTSSVLGGALSYSGTSQGAVNAGSYSITPSGLTSSNYAISYVSGALTINPLAVTISGTVVANSKTYDGTTVATVTGGTLQGVLPADASGVSLGGVFSTANVGTNLPVTATVNGIEAGNYTIAQQPTSGLSANITAVPLTVTANGASKTYNGQAFSGGNGVSYSGFVDGQTVSVLGGALGYSGTSQGAVNAGSYVIMPNGFTSGNYIISYVPGALTINPISLTISGTVVANNKTYDGTTVATITGGTLQGVLPADASGVSLGGVFSMANVGTNLSVTATLNGTEASNYTIAQQPMPGLSANISPAMLTYTATPVTVTAGTLPTGLGGTVTGFVDGQTLASATTGTLSWSTQATPNSAAGGYAIVGSGLTANNGNYTFTQAASNSAAFTVTSSAVNNGGATQPTSNVPTEPEEIAALQNSQNTSGANTSLVNTWLSDTQTTPQDLIPPTLRVVDGGVRLPSFQ